MSDIMIIGIAGGTGSGKTTLVKNLIARFGENITVLSHDNYYKAHDDLTYEERSLLNYDHPDAFDTDLMIEHLKLLKQGRSIHCPVYDYTVHNRSSEVAAFSGYPKNKCDKYVKRCVNLVLFERNPKRTGIQNIILQTVTLRCGIKLC